ncbi:MAG: Biotin synthase [Desulfovibrio sp.]
MPESVHTILQPALEGRPLSRREAESLIPFTASGLRALLGAAVVASGSAVAFTCGIINAKSGRCSEDCSFCAQSRYHKTNAPVYALVGKETLYERASRLAENGVTRMGIVASGAKPSEREFAAICSAARRIVDSVGIGLCASLGVLGNDDARMLRDAGIGSYHHNLETGRSFYPKVCTTHTYDVRVETVKNAKAAGLRVCSGGLFGVGESWGQRLELSETLQELDVDSIPVNFLMAVPGTRLENAPGVSIAEALGLIALLRLMHPGRDIVLCGGRSKALGEWDRLAVLAGANGVMVGDYLTAKGNPFERDMHMLHEAGEICRA